VTIDSVRDDGVHEGGYILPGLMMMRTALLSKTGRIQFEPGAFDRSRSLGNSTAAAVEHGAVHAVLSSIEQACNDRAGRLGAGHVFITGGDASSLVGQLRLGPSSLSCQYVEDLVLNGLQYALP
jgi:type III pantothenate kinase